MKWHVDETDGHLVQAWLSRGYPLSADLHGPLHYLGVMDPLWGATRGVRWSSRGDLTGAWRYDPAVIGLSVGAVFMVAGY